MTSNVRVQRRQALWALAGLAGVAQGAVPTAVVGLGLPLQRLGPGGIAVNPLIAGDPTKVAAAATPTGLRDGSVAGQIANLTGPGSAYNAMVLHLGIESRTVNRQVATQSLVTEQVDSVREATSGVNIDEEMTNLVAIQHAYDASARFITAVDSMLDTLIRSTGLVGR